MAAPFLGLPRVAGARADTRGWLLTTLARTIEAGPILNEGTQAAYRRLRYGPGEPYIVRTELAEGVPPVYRRSLLNFVHHTDMQLRDTESPMLVEYLDRFSDQVCKPIPFDAAFWPQGVMHFQAFEKMLRTVRTIGTSPVTGEPFQFSFCTGDNIDNAQLNELRWFIGIMDGDIVETNSGGPAYEGVQAAHWGTPDTGPDPEYWHPDEGISDKYKVQYGFPDYPGVLEQAVAPFHAHGAGFPWYSCFGNHDGLILGNFPENPLMEGMAVGPFKPTGTPPGFNPCDEFENLRDHPEALVSGPGRLVTADARRAIISRKQYVEEHFRSSSEPRGHGFTEENLASGTAYYVDDRYPLLRMIVLDTTNPGGESNGSIGAAQLAWLEQRLIEVHSRYYDEDGQSATTENPDRLVVLFSHHGIATMNNIFVNPDPFTPEENDQPRFHGPQVEALVHRFPNVILWVNGHSHANRIVPRPDPEGKPNFQGGTNGFWDVTTSSICDWPTQSRLIEIVDNGNGLLSIFCTIVDHSAPPQPRRSRGLTFLASVHREVAANDPQDGFESGKRGEPEDRNVDLVIQAPFPVSAAAPARQTRRPAMAH
jgi:metallophosphoesterase (TIGR03767 family)